MTPSLPNAPLRIAVAGAGARSEAHLTAIASLPRLWRLAGVCDVRAERAAEAGGRFDAPAFTDPLALLDLTKPDALFVVVPPDGHHPLALAAAERGIHVVSEVPISISLPLADLMIDACARHGVVFEVVENTPRSPRERVRQELVRRGLLGPPTVARMTYASGSYHGIGAVCALLGGTERPTAPERAWGWVHDVPVVPQVDFTGLEHATHDWECGVFRWPRDEAASHPGGHPGATLIYEHPPRPGVRNHWEVSGPLGRSAGDEVVLVDPSGSRPSERRYTIQYETATVDGSEVTARAVLPVDPPIVWENPLLGSGVWEPTGPGGSVGRDGSSIAAEQLVDFHHAIVDRTPPAYGAATARRDLELLIAMRESARQGSLPISLPLRETTGHENALHEQFRRTYGHDPVTEWRTALSSLYPRGGITHRVL